MENDLHNPDAQEGMGMVCNYFGKYKDASVWFEKASLYSTDPNQKRNERVNRITAILSGRLTNRFTCKEKDFILQIDPDALKEDERIFTLKAQAAVYYHSSEFQRAANLYRILKGENRLDDTGSVIFYYLCEKSLGKPDAHRILTEGIDLSEHQKTIHPGILREYLAYHYFENKAFKYNGLPSASNVCVTPDRSVLWPCCCSLHVPWE